MAVSRSASAAEKAEADAAENARRKRAARQAVKALDEPQPAEMAQCRVLPMGDGRVSMGQHAAGIGEVHYEKGEVFSVAREIAEALEARGFVEIQDAAPNA